MVCCLLSVITVILCVKIYLLKKAAREIASEFADRLAADTNTLIGISSGDRDMRRLADSINKQLAVLRREHHRYTQGDRELKTAITNISHDLRTPLTAICGYLYMLREGGDKAQTESYLDIITERTEAMKQLTEELFRYSVILSDGEGRQTEEVFVNQALEESISSFYPALTERGIAPRISITDRRIVRSVNRSDLSRVFANLLNNALKYSDGDLDIVLSETGELTFANTARGLSAVDAEQLFDRFFTVEAAHNSTGLGLSIARTLIERMGGSITAEYRGGRLIIRIML